MIQPHEELAQLYDEHAGALFAFLMNFTGQEADARDLLQELFIKLASSPGLLAGARNERAFLLRSCYRLGVNWSRSRQVRVRHEVGFGEQPGVTLFAATDDPDAAVFRQALSGALLDLPVEQRAVINLKLWQGQTFQEIADALDVSLHTAASRYRYALDKLRQRLRPIYEEIQ